MNKKILAVLLAAVLVMSQAVCVFAAPSAQVPTGGGNYGDNFTDVIKDDNALKVIDYINNTDASNAESIQAINDYTSLTLDGGILLTSFYKLRNLTQNSDGMYEFTVYAPNLPDNVNVNDIYGIAFCSSTNEWYMVSPMKLEGKTLTFKTTFMPSAIAIYLPTTTAGTTTSPVTGVALGCGLSMSVAVVASAVSAIAYKKSKEE